MSLPKPNAQVVALARQVAARVAAAQADLIAPLLQQLAAATAGDGAAALASNTSASVDASASESESASTTTSSSASAGASAAAADEGVCGIMQRVAALTFGRPRMKDAASKHGAMRVVAEALCGSLQVGGDGAGDAKESEAGGASGTCMHNDAQGARTCEHGCRALRTLAFNHDGNNREAAKSGAVAAVAGALNAHPGDAAVQTEGLWALLLFCG